MELKIIYFNHNLHPVKKIIHYITLYIYREREREREREII